MTQRDALRLRRGLAMADEAVARGILQRSASARTRLAEAFPGDAETGALAPAVNEAEFAARFPDLACPVLDPDSGACLLYEARPIACRLYGLPTRINGEDLPHCPLCFRRASAEEIEQARAVIDLPDEPAPDEAAEPPHTVVAYAFRGL